MAALNVKRPADLLGRYVTGSYRSSTDLWAFSGVVEAVVLPAPGSCHEVEFFVSGEYVTLADCVCLEIVPPSTVLPVGQLGA